AWAAAGANVARNASVASKEMTAAPRGRALTAREGGDMASPFRVVVVRLDGPLRRTIAFDAVGFGVGWIAQEEPNLLNAPRDTTGVRGLPHNCSVSSGRARCILRRTGCKPIANRQQLHVCRGFLVAFVRSGAGAG